MLAGLDWADLLSGLSLEDAIKIFYNTINSLIDEFVPQKYISKQRFPLWFSFTTRKVIREKLKYHRRWKLYGSRLDYITFSLLRGRSKYLIKQDHANYIKNVERDIHIDSRRFWSYVRNRRAGSEVPSVMLYHDQIAVDGESACQLFSEYFSSVFVSGQCMPLASASNRNTPFHYISESDVLAKLSRLNVRKGPGGDGIPTIFLRNCADNLALPLKILFNLSLSEGHFPAEWKKALIVPIFKSGDRQNVQNYRPISILSTVSKVFESLMYDHLLAAFKTKIIPEQHGFFPGRSVESNLLLYTDYILKALDQKTQVDSIYTDFSKAFDKIDHSILIDKLNSLGIHGELVRWVRSYISNRCQAVKLNGYLSRFVRVTSGVAQGSLLGPLLFLIYINDISSCFHFSKCLLYADDIKIFTTINSISDQFNLQQDLMRFHDYCVINKLYLNYEKCKCISFSRNRTIYSYPYLLHMHQLENVNSIKDLGVIFDVKLLFDKHIDFIVTKCFKMLGFIMRSTYLFANIKTLTSLFYAYVYSVLSYASIIWSPQYVTYINRLESVQGRFVRCLLRRYNMPKLCYEASLIEFGLTRLETRRSWTDVMYLYKICNGLVDSPHILSLLDFNVPVLNTRATTLFRTPFARTNAYRNSPIIRLINTYNNFFQTIDIFNMSINSFKSKVRTALVAAVP